MAARGSEGVEMTLADYEKPWDNEQLLDRYYNGMGYSTTQIADEVFANFDVSSETIRKRLHKFDLMPEGKPRPSSSDPHRMRDLLISMDQDSVGEQSPDGDDSFKKYTMTGRGDPDAQ